MSMSDGEKAKQAMGTGAVNRDGIDRALPARRLVRRAGRRVARAALWVLCLSVMMGCASSRPPAVPARVSEATSLLGTSFYAPILPTAGVARADSALAAAPDDPERILAAAGERATAWRFREAIALYTRGSERFPNDARFYRFRGHRYITVRQFADGARDLDQAALLDSTNFDVVYHQGLAHYLLGHFDRAAQAYGKCLGFATNDALRAREAAGAYRTGYRSCMRTATDDDSRVAMTDWNWRALTRAGRVAEADRLLPTILEGMRVNANRSYYENLLMYKGMRTPEQVMTAAGSDSVRFSTSGYAVANYWLVRGDSARSWEMLEQVARSPHWSGFGVIAAEADLVRRNRR